MFAYLGSVNQFSWWDFPQIFEDLRHLRLGEEVTIESAYNRNTGRKDKAVTVGPVTPASVILYENCVLGWSHQMQYLDAVLVLNTPIQTCFEKTLERDRGRRNVCDIAARFLVTTYSENIFLDSLEQGFTGKVFPINRQGEFSSMPERVSVKDVPVPLPTITKPSGFKGTVFVDLDGTLVKHYPVPQPSAEDLELLPGTVEKLSALRDAGYTLILTTSRVHYNIWPVLHRLKEFGIEFDQVVCDLPIGPRHLINDNKDGECRAYAHPVLRDVGIANIPIEDSHAPPGG